jgi:hypothetical protein
MLNMGLSFFYNCLKSKPCNYILKSFAKLVKVSSVATLFTNKSDYFNRVCITNCVSY